MLQLRLALPTFSLIEPDIVQGCWPIDELAIIIIFFFGIPIPAALKKVIADAINHIFIVTLANNCLEQIIKDKMILCKDVACAQVPHIGNKRQMLIGKTKKLPHP